MRHEMGTIVEIPADGRGSIDGFGCTCSTCGLRLTSSLRGELERDAFDHVAYWQHVDDLRTRLARSMRTAGWASGWSA